MVGVRVGDPLRDRAGGSTQLLVGEPVVPAADGDPVAHAVGRHLEEHRDVHGVDPRAMVA